jgi:copper transport protein
VAGFAGLLAAAALDRQGRAAAGYALAAWVAAAVSFALSGHAATAAPVVLTTPAVAVHAAAFVFWLGALPGMVALAAGSGRVPVPLLRRFARLASPLVAGLVLSGVVLAVVQLGGPALRLDTAYGRLLAAKLAAVAGLLALAAINRWRLVPAIAAGKAGAGSAFRRSVLAEIALGLVIVALASGFRLTPPPRALQAAPAEQYVHLHGPQVMADVVLRPGRPGANDVEILVMDSDFVPMQPLEVSVAFSDPLRGIERIASEAVRDGDVWRAGPVHLPVGGAWTLRLDVLVSDFDKASLEGEVQLGD